MKPAVVSTNSGSWLAFYQGTSMATPQVTGLAAFIWNIQPDLSVNALRDLILDTWTIGGTGILDGYLCALSLDDDLFTAPVRRTLLDVANAFGDSIPDGSFDEHDLARFRERLEFFEQLRIGIPSPAQDYSRFDLNGDGFTGGDYATRFDLDVDSPPSYGPVTQTLQNGTQHFEENSVTDRDILCYYANSPLYQGQDLDVRDSLMIELGCPVCTGAKTRRTTASTFGRSKSISLEPSMMTPSWQCASDELGILAPFGNLMSRWSSMQSADLYCR